MAASHTTRRRPASAHAHSGRRAASSSAHAVRASGRAQHHERGRRRPASVGPSRWRRDPRRWQRSASPGRTRRRRLAASSNPGSGRLQRQPELGDPVADEVLDLGPVVGPGPGDAPVVRLVVHDDVGTVLAQRHDVVRGVLDVAVGLDLRLGPEEAQVAVRDAGGVEPVDRVGHGRGVAPVHVEPVGDDADPHAGVGQPPQRLGDARASAGIVRKMRCSSTAAWCSVLELGGGQAPLAEVPRPLQGQGARTSRPGALDDDVAQRGGVVAAHAVEVDAEDEPVVRTSSRSDRPSRRSCRSLAACDLPDHPVDDHVGHEQQHRQPAERVGALHLDRPVEARGRAPSGPGCR